MIPLISVKNLSAFYENKEIFSNLSFNVNKGDILCVTGENGSGKTTLMRCLLGMPVKHTGNIFLNGFSRREIGWLPQKTQTQSDFPASVNEVVMSGFAGRGVFGLKYSSEQKEKAIKNMKLLEILPLRDRSFKELSGGQQQKVLLCRALCAADKALLLDEPVTGLDEASKDELYSIIHRLNDSGMTIIMISHDIDRSVNQSNSVLHISENGYFFGTPAQYFGSEYYLRLKGEM